MKIIVIGGVAAGTSAAAKARRVNPEAEIILFEKGSDITYAGCGLPYYISGITDSRDKLVVYNSKEFQEKYDVEVKTGCQVVKIDPKKKKLTYTNINSNNQDISEYDKLIIATGASPINPPIPGAEIPGVVNLRTISDADYIKKYLGNKNIKKAVIVGAGFIGLEMAESFRKLGLEVVVIEKQPQVLPSFSKEMAAKIEKHLEEQNVELILDDGVECFKGNSQLEAVYTERGEKIAAGLVLMAVGIRPNVELARKAGIEIGDHGAIKVNKKMETSISEIYAAGDCAESVNLITDKPIWMPLGSTANKQGRIAGENAAGGSNYHHGITKTAITKIFELTAARTGLRKNEAEEAGFNPITVKIQAGSHAGYYPGKEKINLKGVFDKDTGCLLGAEAVGKKGVDKRIDVLSTAVYNSLTAHQLFEIDLAYAPPFSTPKDPAAVLGMVAEKKIK